MPLAIVAMWVASLLAGESRVEHLARTLVGVTALFEEGFIRFLGWALGLLLAFAGASLALVAVYRIFPVKPLRAAALWRTVGIAGAAIAAVSLVFALALGLGANFEEHYAISGIAASVLLGVWLFVSNAIVLAAYVVAVDGRRAGR